MKNRFLDAAKEKGYFVTIVPRVFRSAKDAVVLLGRQKRKGARFELLRERYELVPRHKEHAREIRHARRGARRCARPLVVRPLG